MNARPRQALLVCALLLAPLSLVARGQGPDLAPSRVEPWRGAHWVELPAIAPVCRAPAPGLRPLPTVPAQAGRAPLPTLSSPRRLLPPLPVIARVKAVAAPGPEHDVPAERPRRLPASPVGKEGWVRPAVFVVPPPAPPAPTVSETPPGAERRAVKAAPPPMPPVPVRARPPAPPSPAAAPAPRASGPTPWQLGALALAAGVSAGAVVFGAALLGLEALGRLRRQ